MSGASFAAAVAERVAALPGGQKLLELTIRDLNDRIERCEATLADLRAELVAAEDALAMSRDRAPG